MHTIEIPEKAITVSLPSHWDECTPEQATHILSKAFDVISGQMSLLEFRVHVFIYLTKLKLGWKYHVKNNLGKEETINDASSHRSVQLWGWIFHQRQVGSYELRLDTGQTHIPALIGTYHGPADLLADMTFG